jgi:CRISPR type III-associated protein (TIGR04423 family)
MNIKHYTLLNELPKGRYEGYLWFSDSSTPEVLFNESFDFSTIGVNPFIVEGLLFDRELNQSIHILHNNSYKITLYPLNEIITEDAEIITKDFIAHRIKQVKRLVFKELWLPEPDENCEGLKVKTMKALIFCGFKTDENE